MKSISNWNELPNFENEDGEAKFWDEHQLSSKLMAGSVHESDSRESTTITLRFDPRMLSRIKRIARSRYLNYQSMLKQWLAERLEDEATKPSHKDHP